MIIKSMSRKERTFGQLVDSYQGRLQRLARSFVPSEAVAEEVVQDTWIAVLEGIDRFEGRSSLKTWIYQILMNRAKSKGQRENRYVPLVKPGNPEDMESETVSEPEGMYSAEFRARQGGGMPMEPKTPERLVASKEARERIEQAIQTLAPGQRQVMTLRDIEGMESSEVCTILKISASNQRVLLHRARQKVRQVLSDYLQGSLTLS